MAYMPPYVSTESPVNNALDLIEGELRVALVEATERCNVALSGRTEGTRPLHRRLAQLHTLVTELDTEREDRARKTS